MLTYSVSPSTATVYATTAAGTEIVWQYNIGAAGGPQTSNDGRFYVGGFYTYGYQLFQGVMCDFRWFRDTTLSPAQVDELFAAGFDDSTVTDSSQHPRSLDSRPAINV
eukprot:GFYU01034975.1.p1 GENE.GFYU01034975.1~~GFYU01034975.1.p1  ORF type:complete len:108 (+),score=32.65 GFYU01034975.1:3-326(+)